MMKKMLCVVASALLVLGLAACSGGSSSQSPEPEIALPEGTTLQNVVDEVSETFGFCMPGELTDELMTDLIGVYMADVKEYAGYVTMTMTSADNLIAVKAAEGKTDAVKAVLEEHLEYVRQSFERYLPAQKEKAAAGQVFTVGDYVFLVIIGDSDQDLSQQAADAKAQIEACFHS